MILLALLHGLAALAAPVVIGRLGRRGFLVLALVPGATATLLVTQVKQVFDGGISQQIRWVGQLGLHLDFRLDPLSWVMALIVTVVGALVLVYSAAYFSATSKALARFGGVFVAFAGAMFGLVTADNLLLLYVFWELTTVFSYLLIGHYYERQGSRRAAGQAIMVTTFGGLAMLAGIIGLAALPGGSYQLSVLLENAAAGQFAVGTDPAVLSTLLTLLLLGALSKSALIPFHFWLPAAMAAPTPVSAYLHAAAMVKAGVYLVARLAPAFAANDTWHFVTLTFGLATMLLGGYRALRQHDLKLLLAFGTISQLGMLIAVLGYGTAATALAGLALLVSHSIFKSTLFLTVGAIDWSVGTRDLRKLSGLRKSMPITATAAAIATGSMIGLPLTAGYIAKEASLGSAESSADWTLLIVLTLGSLLTFAYGLRFWFGAFAVKPGLEPSVPRYRSNLILATLVALSTLTLVFGLFAGLLDAALAPYAAAFPGNPGHLQFWHGFTVPLALTALIILGGIGMYLARNTIERWQDKFLVPGAEDGYRTMMRRLDDFAADITAFTQRGSLPVYLMVTLSVMILGAGGIALVQGEFPESVTPFNMWGQIPVAVGAGVAAWLAARARRRLKAVLLAGFSGYAVALLYAMHGGPDIALTQVLVETITLVILVLVLRRLPSYFTNRPFTRDRWIRIVIASLTGAVSVVMALVANAARIHRPISLDFPAATLEHGYGTNIVNVTLVDTRAWDTLGEISVILVAATGVASLLFVRDRFGMVDASRNRLSAASGEVWADGALMDLPLVEEKEPTTALRKPRRGQRWLAAGATLAPRRRSLMFEVGTRLIFPSMILLSVYLLFAGHNHPGGGFAGGLTAGIALAVRYLAAGRYELGEALPIQAGYLLGGGLVVAATAALTPLLFGGHVLQSAILDFSLPLYGDVHLVTSLFFDIGVYLIVLGLVLDLLRSFGAEIDRHGELEGVEDFGDVNDLDESVAEVRVER